MQSKVAVKLVYILSNKIILHFVKRFSFSHWWIVAVLAIIPNLQTFFIDNLNKYNHIFFNFLAP